jgi:sialate O-acetylesterase
LKAEKAGGPYTLKVTGSNKIIIKDVLVGDVWLCTGQSNMEWTVDQSNGYERNAWLATQLENQTYQN